MSVPQKIIDLVEDFEENKHEYTNSDVFDEENTKIKFLNPFFEELGWNVRNEGLSARFREVVFEDTIKVGSKTKAPDYSFRLGGERIFFVEAKKPSRDLSSDKEHAFQVRRYGWSAKLPLCILTDFEELAIYDTTIKPDKNQSSSIGRVKYYKYTDYIDKWDEIYNIFSKEAVLSGKFDNYANNVKHDKKGTTEIDDEFLKEIEQWRLLLARNIALRNPELSIEDLNYAVQLTIDRIIFLRIAEDRGIERYGQLQNLLKKENIYKEFTEICRTADEKYNSGLFHFNQYDKEDFTTDTYTLDLNIDDNIFKEIFKNLYYPNSPYEFGLISTEILGKIYEQFLGKVIRLTPGHQAKIEDKPEVKKAGGVYYTPQYIVDYIVENTLGEKIRDKTPNQISKIKIIDPSCGSGSFLIRAYQYLLDYHVDYYSNLEKPPKDTIYVGRDGITRLTIREKKRILKNNIYGVDLDTLAVEVTKLSLLLKVLEDQNKDQLESQQKLFHERALPNLSSNIKNGNSLIESDILVQQELLLEELKEIKPFDWKEEYPEIFANGGFDVVIGNPPYIRIQELKDVSVNYYNINYEGIVQGNYDTYILFIKKGLEIAKNTGIFGNILPNKFFTSKYGEKIRNSLSTNNNVKKIVNFTTNQIFDSATTYTCLLFLSKNKNNHFEYCEYNLGENYKQLDKSFETIDNASLNQDVWNINDKKTTNILNKISKGEWKFDSITEKIFKGSSTGNDKLYLIDATSEDDKYIYGNSKLKNDVKIEKELMKPFLNGKDVEKYGYISTNRYLLFPYQKINDKTWELIPKKDLKNKYPHAFSYFEEYKTELRNRKIKTTSDDYYKYSAARNLPYYTNTKVLIPDLLVKNRINIDLDGIMYHGPSIHSVVFTEEIGNNLVLSLLTILNSKLFWFFIKNTSTAMRGNAYRLTPMYLNNFHFPYLSKTNNPLNDLAKRIISYNKKLHSVNTPTERKLIQQQIDFTDKKINELVYQLYNLTEEEIKIIEESL